MKIIKVELENWCQYEGTHTFDFGSGGDGNVVLIHADNDIGKSSFFYSIAWCLHQKQPEKWAKNDWPLHPIPWYKAAKNVDQTRTRVSVTFEHLERLYTATRSFITQKTAGGPIRVDDLFMVQKQDASGNWKNDSEQRLQRIFPASVVDYFIFDAEKVEHFVNQSDNVKQSVRRLLDIEDAEAALRHLETVTTELRKDSNRNRSDGSSALEQKIDEIEAGIARSRKELEDPTGGASAKYKQAKDERAEVEQQLFKFKDAHGLLEREKAVEQAIQENKQSQVATIKKIRALTEKLYIPVAYPAVEKAFQLLEEKRRRGELPKDIKQRFVTERIKIGSCICGTSLTKGSKAHKVICEFSDTLSDELSDVSQTLNNGLVAIKEEAKSVQKQLSHLLVQIDGLRTDGKKHDEDLKDVRSKIQGRHDIPDVPGLQRKKEHLENQERELLKQIALLEADIEKRQSDLEENNDLLRTLKKRQRQTDETVKRWMLGTAAQEALSKAISSFKGKARQYLEDQCNRIGAELFWREGVYNIHINEDYYISVNAAGYGDRDMLAGMSMGVTQMTGLALIAALAKQTKAAAPLIMDTPFARLGPAHITRALAECPKHFAQWILFLQPSEWRDNEYRKVLGSRIQKEYTLKRDNKTGKTEAVIGYQPKYFGKSKV